MEQGEAHRCGQQLAMYLAVDSGTRRGSQEEGEGGESGREDRRQSA